MIKSVDRLTQFEFEHGNRTRGHGVNDPRDHQSSSAAACRSGQSVATPVPACRSSGAWADPSQALIITLPIDKQEGHLPALVAERSPYVIPMDYREAKWYSMLSGRALSRNYAKLRSGR